MGGAKKMATAQRKENKGNKGMFCVASVWCYCAHLNVLSDLPFPLSFSLPGAVLHSFAWDLLARYGDGDGFNFGPRRASSAVAHSSRCDLHFFCAVIQKKWHACGLLYMCPFGATRRDIQIIQR
jgi:hypothetical protein